MDEITKFFGLSLPLAYAAAAYSFFSWLDTNMSDHAKAGIAGVMRLKKYDGITVTFALIEIFDRLYTYPLLRARAFIRSAIFTVAITGLFAIVSGKWHVEGIPYVMDKDLYRAFIIFKAAALTAALTVNVVSDYISLLVVERWLIKCASRPIFAVTTAGLIALALVLAGNFLRALITLFITGAVLGFNEVTGTSFSFLNFAFSGEAASYTIPATLVFAWLPLFALGMISIRFLNIGSWLVGKTQWYLKDGNDHPLKAVGYVAGVFVFVLAVCWQTMVPR